MRYKKVSVIALAVLLGVVPSAWFVNAHEDEGTGVPITDPGMVCPGLYDTDLTYAVYFADNMAFAPQWREGNLVRIETLVAKIYDYNGDGLAELADFPIELNTTMWDAGTIPAGTELTQSMLMANPDLLNYTCMVSVPEMLITIEGADGPFYFYGLFAGEDYVPECPVNSNQIIGEVGRETNKAGHVIYGFLWDTAATEAELGDYKVSVWIPAAYEISVAMRTLYIVEEEPEETLSLESAPDEDNDPMGFEPLPVWTTGDDLTWTGGVDSSTNEAFIWIGELVGRGSSSDQNGNGGNDDSGGDHENGNGGDGGGDHENGNGGARSKALRYGH